MAISVLRDGVKLDSIMRCVTVSERVDHKREMRKLPEAKRMVRKYIDGVKERSSKRQKKRRRTCDVRY
jgi:hypothetical protein